MQHREGHQNDYKTDKYFLIGDVGGTNLRIELRSEKNEVVKKLVTKTSEYKNFSECLKAFFSDLKVDPVYVWSAISIASKILNNRAVTKANYNWELADGNLLKEEFYFREMILLNDFEACGYSVPSLDQNQITVLKGEALPDLKKDFRSILVGPGTGLGVCILAKR